MDTISSQYATLLDNEIRMFVDVQGFKVYNIRLSYRRKILESEPQQTANKILTKMTHFWEVFERWPGRGWIYEWG